ncbi:MAG: ABC transporter permease [Pyrinomonadaceae bacterium MAG19_C2-C3]|nr:ABC transporter permease [Pyrinomonadaceae bacterium MAG19_C2-C3]
MTTLWQDIKYGARMLLKTPGFTLVAVFALALGIGANTAIFSVVNGVLLKPLPFVEPERITRFYNATTNEPASIAYPDFQDYANRAQSLQHVAGYLMTGTILRGGDEPERVRGANVSASLFPMLGVNAALGRVFTAEEDRDGAPSVIVISHELWQRRFGGDAGVIGQQIPLGANPKTVIGVMPPNFKFPVATTFPTEYWLPLSESPSVKQQAARRGSIFLDVVASLKPGVSVEGANAELDTIARTLEAQYPNTNTGRRVRLVKLHESLVSDIKPALLVLLGAVGLVLLIACANVANLLLARAAARGKEIAVRTALGASRGRIVRQLLTESLLLALTGGGLGLLLAVWGIDLLVAASPAGVPRLQDVRLDMSVLLFTFGISTLTGVLFGLAPALQASKLDLNHALKEGGRGSTEGGRGSRVRSVLVVTEVALSLVLLVGAGLLIKSFYALLNTDPGYATDRVLTMTLPLSTTKYPQPEDRAQFFQQVLRSVNELPGVEAAGATAQLPLGGSENISSFNIEGRPPAAPGSTPTAGDQTVTPDYFRAMNIPLLKGRTFTEQDTNAAPPVLIVNETFARRHFPNDDPVGKRIIPDSETGSVPPREIIGVVGDARHQDLSSIPYADAYSPYAQNSRATMHIVVRAKTADPNEVAPAVRAAIKELNGDQLIWQTRTMNELVAGNVAPRRFNMILLGVFAAVALMLAAVGIFGVMNYVVTQRTHEIGIRIALGAQTTDVLRLIVAQGMMLALIGVGLGLAGSFAASRVLRTLLYGVSATDPMTFIGVSVLLAVVALLACYIPARRAMKVDPMIALRYE